MVNEKRIERKLPLLITDAPWWSTELDRNEYRVKQFKKRMPQKYRQHCDALRVDLEKLKRDVDALFNNGA
jgi:hypothetical protein